MREVVVVSGCRTAIGAFGGSLKESNAPAIAAVTMIEAIKRAGIEAGMIDDVRYGCCIEPMDAFNVSRVAALLSSIPAAQYLGCEKQLSSHSIFRQLCLSFQNPIYQANAKKMKTDEH